MSPTLPATPPPSPQYSPQHRRDEPELFELSHIPAHHPRRRSYDEFAHDDFSCYEFLSFPSQAPQYALTKRPRRDELDDEPLSPRILPRWPSEAPEFAPSTPRFERLPTPDLPYEMLPPTPRFQRLPTPDLPDALPGMFPPLDLFPTLDASPSRTSSTTTTQSRPRAEPARSRRRRRTVSKRPANSAK